MYGRDAHVTCPTPEAAARFLARRALETLVFLTRASNVFAARVAVLAVRPEDVEEVVTKAERGEEKKKDVKGKRPVTNVSRTGLDDIHEEGDLTAVGADAAPLVLLRMLCSHLFEPHSTHIELALGALLSVLSATKRERERFTREWKDAVGGDATLFIPEDEEEEKWQNGDGTTKKGENHVPKSQKISNALEPWRMGFLPGLNTAGNKKQKEAPLGGLKPLSSSVLRSAISSAPPSVLRALASLVARDALTHHAQTKAAEAVRYLAITAPEARAPLAAAFAAATTGILGFMCL